MKKTAIKTKPALWSKIVKKVKGGSKGGQPGQWSARKAQIAVKEYKNAGGGYKGHKSSQNDLTKWSNQDWDYINPSDKKKPKTQRGRYLPKSVRSNLTKSEKSQTNKQKREASKRGQQKAKYSKSVAKKVRRATR